MAETKCISEVVFARIECKQASLEETSMARLHARTCTACARRLEALLRDRPDSLAPTLTENTAEHSPEPHAPPSAQILLPPPPGTGKRIGRYLTLRSLGAGGHGEVFVAYDLQLERKVALKLLWAHETGGKAQLLHEAQAMASLSHPNVVAVHDVGEHESGVFLAMDFVDGGDVHRWLRAAKRSWREILQVFLAAGKGLAAAHEKGLVHRDIKPANVLLSADGVARITDFGIAELPGPAPSGSQIPALAGTPGYLAPEQLEGQKATALSDQFAFAVSLWQALYGKRPFGGTSLEEQLLAVRQCELGPPPAGSQVPARVHQVLVRALSKAPAARFPSMGQMLAALADDPWRRRRRSLPAIAALVAALVAAALFARSELGKRSLCDQSRARLAGVWDPSRRQAAGQALLATGHPRAPQTWDSLSALLDRYAEGWGTMAQQACEASLVRGAESPHLFGLRSACLDRRLAELRALAGLVEHADAAFVDRALQVASSLSPLASCADASALEKAVEPPADPAARASIHDLHERLDRARLHRVAAQYDAALSLLDPLEADAAKLGWRPLQARIAHQRGLLLEERDDLQGSEAALYSAVARAEAGNDRATLAAAASRLMYVLGALDDRPVEALAWGELAVAALEAVGGGEPALQADVHSDRCAVLLEMQRPVDALAEGQRALELRRAVFGESHYLTGRALNNVGVSLGRVRREAEGLEHVRRAVAIVQPVLGPDHVQTLLFRNNESMLLRVLGRAAEAESVAVDVAARSERALGEKHRVTSFALLVLSRIRLDLGKADQARGEADRLYRLNDGKDALSGSALCARGAARVQLGEREAGLADEVAGTALIDAEPRHFGPEMLEELANLGDAYASLDRWPEAIAAYQRGLEAPFPELHEPRFAAQLRMGLARALWEKGDRKRARAVATEAAEILRKADTRPKDAAEAFRWLASHP
ncbi:MAG: protein kinase [Myxococcales bacterium]